MSENQKDHRNQQSDSKSHLERTQDGKKKKETNPNNPKADQNNQHDTHQGNKPNQGSVKGETSTTVEDKEVEETTSEQTKSPNAGKGNL